MANKPRFCISCKIAIILLLLCLLSPAVLAEPEAVTAARQSVVHLYGMGTDSETGWETVTVHVGRLRKRFEGWKEFEIVAVRGLGYKAVKHV